MYSSSTFSYSCDLRAILGTKALTWSLERKKWMRMSISRMISVGSPAAAYYRRWWWWRLTRGSLVVVGNTRPPPHYRRRPPFTVTDNDTHFSCTHIHTLQIETQAQTMWIDMNSNKYMTDSQTRRRVSARSEKSIYFLCSYTCTKVDVHFHISQCVYLLQNIDHFRRNRRAVSCTRTEPSCPPSDAIMYHLRNIIARR